MKNQIGNNNEINKKKYKKSLPPKLNPDAGNVQHNIDMFNKASSGDANLSSAAGMNGMAESYDRESLIARITEFGKHYNFDKYTDAQLNAMLNRLVDAENYRKRVLPKHQDKIDIQSDRHIMNDDPSYNFDDPDREGEYRVENLREALNRLDHYCIDNDKIFYDLRSLYENIQHQLTAQEKQELKKLVDTTNDPDAIKAYIDSKDPDKKNEELDESISSWQDAYQVFINIVNKYLPDVDRIDTEVENIYLKNAGNPAFEKAFHKWIEEYKDDIDAEAEEEEDQVVAADWTDETDADFDESLKEAFDYKSAQLIDKILHAYPDISPDDEDYLYSLSYDSLIKECRNRGWEDLLKDWENELKDFDESLKESADNLTYDELIDLAHKYYKQGGMEIIEFWDENSLKEYEKEFGPMTKKQAIRLMKVMGNVSKDEEEAGEYFAKQTFEEGLNRKELETFSRAIFNAGDKNEALEIIDQIYQYDRNLSLQLKDMWDESASVAYNTDKLSGYLLRYNESLEEGVLDDLRAKRDARKRAQDPLYDKMRQWQDQKENPEKYHLKDFVYDQKFRYEDRDKKAQTIKNVESVIFDLETIPAEAFMDCSNLKSISFKRNPIIIGRKAFMNCTGLTDVALPESVHTIEDEAFKGCSNLEHLTIPNRKVDIGQNVFEGCTKLQKNKNEELIQEDTVKQGNKWVNKGDSGKTHGKFNTKKQADAQRKAMFANGYKGESLKEDSDDYYTKLISKTLGPAVQKFMNSSTVNGQQIRDAVREFFDEYNKIPSKGMDSLDTKYDCDKDRFYQKYKSFVDKCKEVNNTLKPTGYGKTDYFDIKVKELLKKVDYNFPYGWKVYKGISDRQKIGENFNRQNLKLTLNEDLFDDVVDIIVPDVETDFTVNTIDSTITETPNPGNDTGVSNLIIKAINGEWDTIAEYNELIANLGNNSDMIPVIQDIVAEENTHIGQLQQILLQISPNVQNIEKGEVEGEKQLQETIE